MTVAATILRELRDAASPETSPSAEGIAPPRRDSFQLPKLGLVLEGGGMRGLFTAGVLDALYEMGVRFDGIIGVSAGAAFGCN